jgi:hypothetical protein
MEIDLNDNEIPEENEISKLEKLIKSKIKEIEILKNEKNKLKLIKKDQSK